MPLTPGTRLGTYEVIGPLGAGGMGEVYRARDTRLDRDVALKILPASVAGDPDRLMRFEREAKTLAALNHPGIAQIFGIEESNGVRALVMELVEGEDLSVRISRGAIPLEQALPIARQIAVALSAAHELGIIHRDLKPANIKVKADGTVKVLDFGLAKALDSGSGTGSGARTPDLGPTMTSPALTQMGVILGTAAYMSPEQARGQSADRRADVWGFGCILYEMLAGRRVFAGHTVSDTLASVLKEQPDWKVLPASAPPAIARLLRRSLAKDPARRLHDISDALLDLDDAIEGGGDSAIPPDDRTDRRRLLPWILVALMGAVSAWNAWRVMQSAADPQPTVTASILPPAAARFDVDRGLALSPDGSHLAVVVRGDDGVRRLWLRPIEREDGVLLKGTEEASVPFWSPDSRTIAFAAGGTLKKIDIGSGVVESIATCDCDSLGGAWGPSGQILIGGNNRGGGIRRIPAGGGTPVPVSQTEGDQVHQWPAFLPDGKHFLYLVRDYGSQAEQGEIRVGSIDGAPGRALARANSNAAYAAPGILIWWHDGNLRAQRFAAEKMALQGESSVVAAGARFDPRSGYAAFTVSPSGTLVYERRTGTIANELVWLDRQGRDLGVLGPNDSYYGPVISPDGTRVATDISDQTNRGDIWLLDVARGAATRLTSWPEDDSNPVWSPTSREVAFFSLRGGARSALYVQALGAAGDPRLVARENASDLVPTSWSRSGHLLVDRTGDAGTDIHVYSFHDQSMRPYLTGPFNQRAGAFSPDDRLVAFTADETGQSEIYVASFPDAGERFRVSAAGGGQAVWRRDGRELFYISMRGELMAVPVERGGTGPGSVTIGVPRPLFRVDIKEHAQAQFDTITGERFLVNRNVDSGADRPLTLVLRPVRIPFR